MRERSIELTCPIDGARDGQVTHLRWLADGRNGERLRYPDLRALFLGLSIFSSVVREYSTSAFYTRRKISSQLVFLFPGAIVGVLDWAQTELAQTRPSLDFHGQ